MGQQSEVIHHLNHALGHELVSINQYMVHARMWDHLGYTKLGQRTYQEALDEMKHADKLIQRILFLDGQPALSNAPAPQVGQTPENMLAFDLALEERGIAGLRAAILASEQAEDFVTRQLFEAILADEESHMEQLQTDLQLIQTLGLVPFLQSML